MKNDEKSSESSPDVQKACSEKEQKKTTEPFFENDQGRKKLLKEWLAILLEKDLADHCDDKEDQKQRKQTGAEAMAIKAFEEALDGDWTAWKLIRDTIGEKPSEKTIVSEVDPAIIEEIEKILYEGDVVDKGGAKDGENGSGSFFAG